MGETGPEIRLVKPQPEPQQRDRYSVLSNINASKGVPLINDPESVARANRHNEGVREKIGGFFRRGARRTAIAHLETWNKTRPLVETAYNNRLAKEAAQTNLRLVESQLSETQNTLSEREREIRTDALTGLPNEQAYNEDLQRKLESGEEGLVGYGDIDDFKTWNEVYGHTTGGDQALKALINLPANIYRIHGDELAIIFEEQDLEKAAQTLTDCNERYADIGHLLFDKAKKSEGTKYKVPPNLSTSWGVTELVPGDTVHTASKRSDFALGRAKEEGARVEEKGKFYFVDGTGTNFSPLTAPVARIDQEKAA